MYSNSDFEKVWFLYKTEGEPKGVSINSFCVSQGVPYNQFNDWFRKTHKKIVPVQIDGLLLTSEEPVKEDAPKDNKEKGHIMLIIQSHDGLQIKKKNLSYPELKQLVEKLEGLCWLLQGWRISIIFQASMIWDVKLLVYRRLSVPVIIGILITAMSIFHV